MIQEILMWICITSAFGYTFYSLYKTIKSAYQENKSGCSGACGGCSAKNDLLKNIKQNKIKLAR